MEYGRSGGNGYNAGMAPSYQNRCVRRGHLSGYGRYSNNALPYPRGQNDMEYQIHLLEQEAYISVLRAFKAQSNDLTWEKEGIITELRKELRVSDDEHRELLSKANTDDLIKMIREWRQAAGPQTGLHSNTVTGYELLGSPIFSGSRKRQKTIQPPPMNPRTVMGPTSSHFGSKSRKPSSSLQIPSTNRMYSGFTTEPVACNPLIGKKVWLKWPRDNMFYEGVITDYNGADGTHAVVYKMNTGHEEWEWITLNEIAPDDIQWEAPGIEKPTSQAHTDREKNWLNNQPNKDLVPLKARHENISDVIEIRNTETVIKELETIFASAHVDPSEIDKAKKTLREHEQSLIDAIAKLTAAANDENEEGNAAVDNQHWMRQHSTATASLRNPIVAGY